MIVDTNVLSAFFAKEDKIVLLIRAAEFIYIPSIVIGELTGGFHYGNRLARNEAILSDFLQESTVKVVSIGEEVAKVYGELYAYLRKIGRPIPTNDIWIAACALSTGQPLLTKDGDFDNLPQVRRIVL